MERIHDSPFGMVLNAGSAGGDRLSKIGVVMRSLLWRNIHRFVGLPTVAFYLLLLPLPSMGEEKEFDREMIGRWKVYEDLSRSLQGVERTTIFWDFGKTERTEKKYKQNHQCMLRCVVDEQKPAEYCLLVNTCYAASLKRDKSDQSRTVLDQFTEDPKGEFPRATKSAAELIFPGIAPHFCVGTTPLTQFATDPSYKVQKISTKTEKGRDLVQIDYSLAMDDPKRSVSTRGQGWVLLDAARWWCVLRTKRSSKMSLRGAAVLDQDHEVDFEIVDHPSGFPVVKSSTSRDMIYTHRTQVKKTYRTNAEYEWEVDDSVPDAEFTLTAFGLPEPGGQPPVKKPLPLYVWILASAGGCSTLALGFWYLARRVRAKPAA